MDGGHPVWASSGVGADVPLRASIIAHSGADASATGADATRGAAAASVLEHKYSSSSSSSSSSGGGGADALSFLPLSSPLQARRTTPGLSILNLLYDVTPASLVSWILCEAGALTPDAVGIVLREFSALEQAAPEGEPQGDREVEEDGAGGGDGGNNT